MLDILGHEVKMGDFILLLPNYKHRYFSECNFGLLISENKAFVVKDKYKDTYDIEKVNGYLLQFPDTDIKKRIYINLSESYAKYCVEYAKEVGNYYELIPGHCAILRNKGVTTSKIYLGRLSLNIYKKDGTGFNYSITGDMFVERKYLIENGMLNDNEVDLYKLFGKVVYARALADISQDKSWKKKLPKIKCFSSNWLRVVSCNETLVKLRGKELIDNTSIIDVSVFNNPEVKGEYVLKIESVNKINILEKLD